MKSLRLEMDLMVFWLDLDSILASSGHELDNGALDYSAVMGHITLSPMSRAEQKINCNN